MFFSNQELTDPVRKQMHALRLCNHICILIIYRMGIYLYNIICYVTYLALP